ncbi:hypothetical protein A3K72_03365, partial [Candidatus Woesearchaeota archaeon RBG_13_36_6]
MIRQSFIFLDRVGDKLEQNIWAQGIRTWDDFLAAKRVFGIADYKKRYYDRMIERARQNLYRFDSSYFFDLLHTAEHWRVYEFFRDEAVFLDIETSGVKDDGFITVVGLFDGIRTKTMVNGINLDFDVLRKELSKYKMIVTFNGLSFDVPFLEKSFPDLLPKVPHFDLRHACQRVGLRGGLKQVEKELGIERRNKIVERLYGGDALTLWRMFRATGDE